MFSNVNIWLIVQDHIGTWKNFRTGRIWIPDILLFLVTPMAAAPLLVFGLGFRLDTETVNVLVTSLSVFSALLFNLLLLIFDILRKDSGLVPQAGLRRQFLSYIYSNISFGILTAVVSIALMLLLYIKLDLPLFTDAINVLVDFLVINFMLTMFMILKRVHILIRKEIQPASGPAGASTVDTPPQRNRKKKGKARQEYAGKAIEP